MCELSQPPCARLLGRLAYVGRVPAQLGVPAELRELAQLGVPAQLVVLAKLRALA